VDEELTIGEAAERAGMRTSTLRYYERVGLLKPARRVSGQRRYQPGIIDTLRLVSLAQEAGFTIAEIRTLLRGFEGGTPASERWNALARTKLAEVKLRIEQAHRMEALLHALLDCRCLRLEDCARYCAPNGEPNAGTQDCADLS